MKFLSENITNFFSDKLTAQEISPKLIQLGHEHELSKGIFDFEFTPNRGDCLSAFGLSRDLRPFFNNHIGPEIYIGDIKKLKFDFENEAKKQCPQITFLKVDIGDEISPYCDYLENYFKKLEINKVNFFTDISNFVAYELGQPTHCYDFEYVADGLTLTKVDRELKFKTLLGKEIVLEGENLVFKSRKDELVNLAGIMGSISSGTSNETRSVLIECAYFAPESIIGKSIQYDINSEAAYRFERGVDRNAQENTLRRFLKIVSDHASILNAEIITNTYSDNEEKTISTNVDEINNILGTKISGNDFNAYLSALGFKINHGVHVPSYRSDIYNKNDIAEEIARVMGYENITKEDLNISVLNKKYQNNLEDSIKLALMNEGFSEVINFPFSSQKNKDSIALKNPLDSSKKFMRTSLRNSLINNLLYNERRQKDSLKFFEISKIYKTYPNTKIIAETHVSIICSGRVGKTLETFNKKIDMSYIRDIVSLITNEDIKIIEIDRNKLKTKSKNKIFYAEFILEKTDLIDKLNFSQTEPDYKFIKYDPISEFPSSTKDFSFLIEDFSMLETLVNYLINVDHKYLKESFIFDFYENEKKQELKVAARFIFQSKEGTLSEEEINKSISQILGPIMEMKNVSIPGL